MNTLPAKEICTVLEDLAPAALAEPWDNVGLLAGSPDSSVSKILVGLDPTHGLIHEAVACDADLIITHHPIIFHPLKAVRTDQPTGSLLAKVLDLGITMIACHTNLDAAENGVNALLANILDIHDTRPIQPDPLEPSLGLGRIGRLSAPVAAETFLSSILNALDLPSVRCSGPMPTTVATVAVCGGSGGDLSEAAFDAGADIYVTGEIKLSTARWAEEAGCCIVDAGHFATEIPIITHLCQTLSHILAEKGTPLPVSTSTTQRDPFYTFFHPSQTETT